MTIAESVALLTAPGAVYELRAPEGGCHGTISGYFDDPAKLAAAAAKLDGHCPGIYITLNPCKSALLARASNRYKTRAKVTTSDQDIQRRRWLALDFDPVRPAGVSSTEYEHGRAIATACGTWDELRAMGWGDPILADSGNGAHLLYRLDAPNTPEVTDAVKRATVAVASRCTTDDTSIDLTVFNPARIWKLYGTMSGKGDSTPERPHRRSQILEVPAVIGTAQIRI